jgi:hypothetical protein
MSVKLRDGLVRLTPGEIAPGEKEYGLQISASDIGDEDDQVVSALMGRQSFLR